MRKYSKNGRLETVVCNMCGKKIAVKEGIVREGAAMFDHAVGLLFGKGRRGSSF